MATTTTTRKALTALLIIVASTLLSLPRSEATATVTGIVTENVTAADQAAYDTAIDLLTSAGFDIPTFRAAFHTTTEACQGYRGLHVRGEDGIATIHVCAVEADAELQATRRARVLLHEIAHAWVDQNVTDEAKAVFLTVRGLDNWADGSQDWEHRGTEHAAEVVIWGLQDGDYRPHFLIENASCDEMASAFETLTGVSVGC